MIKMKMMMKRKLFMAAVILAILLAVIAATLALWGKSDYNSVLQANWDISLPSAAKYDLIYTKDSGASFHGDGERFHIFTYLNQSPIEEMFQWKAEEDYSSYLDAVDEWLDSIEVPSEHRPNYADCLYWHNKKSDGSEIIILWDHQQELIYVAESFF